MAAIEPGTFFIAGRLDRFPKCRIERAIIRRGGGVSQRLTPRVDHLVIGHGAVAALSGPLHHEIAARRRAGGARVVSEDALLRWLGLAPGLAVYRDLAETSVLSLAGLDPETLFLLETFDVVARQDGAFGFEDLRNARAVARLLDQGVPLATILETAMLMRRRGRWSSAELAALEPVGGTLLIRGGGVVWEPGGQIPLGIAGVPADVDAIFAEAEAAAEAGLDDHAERLYRVCLQVAPHDPVIHFNLGNMMRKLERRAVAQVHYLAALAAEPGFAEAHYNLGHLAAEGGELHRAAGCMERALRIDPDYADAIYALAQIMIRLDRYDAAAPLLRRYLALDPSSAWSGEARRVLLACRAAADAEAPGRG